jgi:hypothetical protein
MIYPLNVVIFHGYVNVYQRLWLGMAHNDQPIKTMLRTGYYQFMGHFVIRNKPASDYGKPPWKRINHQSTMMNHHLSK